MNLENSGTAHSTRRTFKAIERGQAVDDKEVTIGEGQVLFRQNEKGGDLYFIKTGTVELSVRDEETGTEAIVATIGDRSVIGTMSFRGAPRSAATIAKGEVKLVRDGSSSGSNAESLTSLGRALIKTYRATSGN